MGKIVHCQNIIHVFRTGNKCLLLLFARRTHLFVIKRDECGHLNKNRITNTEAYCDFYCRMYCSFSFFCFSVFDLFSFAFFFSYSVVFVYVECVCVCDAMSGCLIAIPVNDNRFSCIFGLFFFLREIFFRMLQ